MLDVHAVTFTPGATTTLGGTDAVMPNDGAQVAGVPLRTDAVLRMWGAHSPTANTIAAARLQSQDQIDPINGVNVQPGTSSTLNQWYDYTTLAYNKGARIIQAGTNTAQTAMFGFYIDEYANPQVAKTVAGRSDMGNDVVTGPTSVGALTANTWFTAAYSPTNPLPNGKYAILGVECHGGANAALIRFSHPDFGGLKPGFPVATTAGAASVNVDKVMKDDLMLNSVGEQFIYLGKVFGRPMCPVFTVSNAGTGLNIEMASVQADTWAVTLFLSKIE